MKFLEKEIIIKKTVISMLLESIFKSLILAVIIFILLGPLNETVLQILNAINNGKFNALSFTIILIPMFMVIGIILTLIRILIRKK